MKTTITCTNRTKFSNSPVFKIEANWSWNGGYSEKTNHYTVMVALTNEGEIYRIVGVDEVNSVEPFEVYISEFTQKLISEFDSFHGSFEMNYELLRLNLVQKYELEFCSSSISHSPIFECERSKSYYFACVNNFAQKREIENLNKRLARLCDRLSNLLNFVQILTDKKFGVKPETIEKRVTNFLAKKKVAVSSVYMKVINGVR